MEDKKIPQSRLLNNIEAELKIDDFRDLGFQYLAYLGKDYIKCEMCGKVIKRNSNRIKYCTNCYKEKRKEINANYYKSKNLRPLENQ